MDESTKKLIQAYLEKAESKLKAANNLLEKKYYDDAVSRFYYVVFHAAQAILLTEGLHADTHRGLINLFGLHFIKAGKIEPRYGKLLANLKDDRETGDYEIVSFVDEETAENAKKEAESFLKKMKEYLASYLA